MGIVFRIRFWEVTYVTHCGRGTHICVSNLTTIGSVNGLLPGRRQAITWTNAGILLIGRLGTHFSEILIEIPTFSFKKMRLKVSSAKWRPFCHGLNVLNRSSFKDSFPRSNLLNSFPVMTNQRLSSASNVLLLAFHNGTRMDLNAML